MLERLNVSSLSFCLDCSSHFVFVLFIDSIFLAVFHTKGPQTSNGPSSLTGLDFGLDIIHVTWHFVRTPRSLLLLLLLIFFFFLCCSWPLMGITPVVNGETWVLTLGFGHWDIAYSISLFAAVLFSPFFLQQPFLDLSGFIPFRSPLSTSTTKDQVLWYGRLGKKERAEKAENILDV